MPVPAVYVPPVRLSVPLFALTVPPLLNGTFTRLVVRRMRSSSSMATIAIRYGGGKLGIHICSLFVNPATTARPDTSAGAHSCDRQYGHTALGGWRSSPHSEHRWKRSVPSSPDFQKNSLLSVSSGNRRPDESATVTPRLRQSAEPTCEREKSTTFGRTDPGTDDGGAHGCLHS